MQRHSRTLATVALVLVAPLLAGLPSPSAAAAAPVRDVTVTGAGVGIYPAYAEATDRFAVTTNGNTDGTVTVTASSSDPDGTIRIDGRPAGNGAETLVSGLSPGDEVNVQITDAGGSTNQSFLYLPTGFPRINPDRQGTGPDQGLVFLGLASYLSETAYETAVDGNGVPVRVTGAPKAHDFKPSGLGDDHYTVARLLPGSTNEDAGYQITELGPRFGVVDRHTLRPVKGSRIRPDDTDFHDVQLLPDGRVILVGYQRFKRANGTTWLDAVIQVLGRGGKPRFTWTSRGEVRPKEAYVLGSRGQDYAHLNSVEMQGNGDIVASFRNTGQVLRIATRKHHGHRPGDVIWRLGGERNEFTFIADPSRRFLCPARRPHPSGRAPAPVRQRRPEGRRRCHSARRPPTCVRTRPTRTVNGSRVPRAESSSTPSMCEPARPPSCGATRWRAGTPRSPAAPSASRAVTHSWAGGTPRT